jgi:uncharacterized protein
MLRERFAADLKDAIKARDAALVSTLRLILAAIKDRDIAARAGDNTEGVSEADILAILGKMVRQRKESAKSYEEGGRLDLAEKERAEIEMIRQYLPRPMSETEMRQAIDTAIAETGAASIRDMGRVMAALKERHTGQMDFAKAGAAVKSALG